VIDKVEAMELLKNLIKQIFNEGTVEDKERLSESVYRISLKSKNIKTAEFHPGYFLRVLIGMNNPSDKLFNDDFVRSYSVWDIDKTEGTIDLAIATHSEGAGAKWIRQIDSGDKVLFRWKKGNFVLDDAADSYLMIGDVSALSHLYNIGRNLGKGKHVESIIYSAKMNDFFADIDRTAPFSFHEMPENPIDEIIYLIRTIIPKMKGRKMVYIGGDSRVCVALRKYFRQDLHWEAKQIKTKPFWNPEKKGLE
jgi:NADPH-dependent ferric siderophore reductase